MIRKDKKIKKLVIEYDDGTVDMLKKPTGMIVLLDDKNEMYKRLYGDNPDEKDDNDTSDEQIQAEIANINCNESEALCCVDAFLQFAHDYGLVE